MKIPLRRSPGFLSLVMAALLAVVCVVSPARAQESVLHLKVTPDREKAAPGGQVVLAVEIDLAPGYHVYEPSVTAKGAEPVQLTIDTAGKVRLGLVQWSKDFRRATFNLDDGPVEVPIYLGHTTSFIPVLIDADAAGEQKFTVTIAYQACNDDGVCLRPATEEAEATVVVDAGASAAVAASSRFDGFDPSGFATVGMAPVAPSPTAAGTKGTSETITLPFFGLDVVIHPNSAVGVALLLLFAMIGGVILNFTPCVLPVIPLKIMSLQRAADDRRRCFYLGLMMSLGVVAFWLGIGLLVVGIKTIGAVSEIYRYPWAVLGIGAFIGVMALGMMGLFTIQLPQAIYNITPKHDTAAGSFGFGIMTAILGTPCFGPFAGGAAGGATSLPIWTAMSIFGAIGVGMALPYLVLSAKPSLASKLPRTGPASELIKQVMGLLLMAAAAFFIGTAILGLSAEYRFIPKVVHWWFVALFATIAAGWLLIRTFQITTSRVKRAVYAVIALLVAAAANFWAIGQTNNAALESTWSEYTPEALEKAAKEGKVVVIDFTAEWCLNCKVIEAAVLNRNEVRRALKSEGVVALKADLTAAKAQGWAKLSDLHEVGIPLLVIYGPGLSQPFKSNAYTPAVVLQQIDAARPKASPAASK